MQIPRRTFTLTSLAGALLPAAAAQANASLSERVRETQWAAVRGVNFIPSYGRNLYEIWRAYDRDIFDNELRLARSLGYNSVRLWLNYFAFAERGAQAIDDIEAAVRLCAANDLKALIVLFDGCGVRPRPDTRDVRIQDAYDAFLNSPRLSAAQKAEATAFYGAFATGPGRDIIVPVADETPAHVLLWQHWLQNPGLDRMAPEAWPALDSYVRAVVNRLAGHEAVLAWDIMNEPEFSAEDFAGMARSDVRRTVSRFLSHVHDVIKHEAPNEVVTIGFASLAACEEFAALADVLSFHVYGEPDALATAFANAHALAQRKRKPILITETLANFSFPPLNVGALATDEGQLRHYQNVLPALLDSGVGWMAWGLMVGRLFNPYCDIIYSNGLHRPAATYLQSMLRGGS